jgi:hypothetical protein
MWWSHKGKVDHPAAGGPVLPMRSNFRIQATAGTLRSAMINGAASPAAPDRGRWADFYGTGNAI